MRRRLSDWWSARSLTLRLTIIATVVLALGLTSGAAALGVLFFHNRLDAVDANVRAESATINTLIGSGQVPDPLPVPAGQPVLAQILDSGGNPRAASPSASRLVPLLPLSEIAMHQSGQPFTTTETALGPVPFRVMVTSAHLNGQLVTVITAVPFSDVRATLAALFRTLAIAVPIVLLAAGVATWLAVSSALRPVDQLRMAADEVADTRGRTAPLLPVPPSGDELARLAETLNQMLERLHGSAEQQRAFVADAAHELRSPIAAIRAQLEVALATPTDAAEWATVASDVLEDVERVGQLADDMLLLARLDSGVSVRRQLVDVGVVLDLPAAGLWAEADEQALRRAVDNLVSNANRHARHEVAVSAEAVGGDIVVTVDDDGSGIPPDERERVFERWVRLDDARTRDQGGAGLGLAIARSVARTHGGDVTLAASPLGGLRAELRIRARTPMQGSDTGVGDAGQTPGRGAI